MSTETPAPAAQADERLAYRGPIQRLLTRPEIGGLIGAGSIWIFFWSVSDVFGTTAGINNYLDVATSLGIMAIAVALLMIGGEFDLSSGAMTGATGMLVVLLVKDTGELGGLGLPLTIAIPITFLFAMGVGWLNGTLVERTGLPSFIVTLGTFFVLRGAKLGFSKLFVDKVIVEGLDDAPDYDFWANIFGAVWIRNDHLWDSFLGGRDLVFGVLAAVGATAIAVGFMELSMVRRAKAGAMPSGMSVISLIIGLVAGFGGLITLTRTDGVANNWTWSLVMAAGAILAIYGYSSWRFESFSGSSGELSLGGPNGRRALIGLGLIVVGTLLGMFIDSTNTDVLGLLLTVQALAGLSVAVVGFVIQTEAVSRKYRAEFFAWMMAAAVLLIAIAVVRMRFDQRRHADDDADRFGTLVSISGVVLVLIAIATKLLWATSGELEESRAIITYRISILYFFVFAGVATWILMRTKFGSWTFAVGGNKSASRQVGVPAARTKTQLFMVVSGAAWLVGTLIAFRLNSVQANVGDGLEFFYIIAAVVGGNLLTGGYGSAAGAAIGALIMAMSFQGIPFAGWNSDWRFLFVGVILLLAVMVNNYVRGRAEKST